MYYNTKETIAGENEPMISMFDSLLLKMHGVAPILWLFLIVDEVERVENSFYVLTAV